MKTSFSLISLSLFFAQVAGECSLCPGGSRSITDIRAQLGGIEGGTCGEIEDRVKAGGTDDDKCIAIKNDINSEFDYSKFCCSDVTISNIQCSLCNGRKIDVNRILPADTNPQGLTCGETKAIADVTKDTDSFTCQQILGAAAKCCDASCSVCNLGSTLGNGSRIMPGQETLTCQEFNLELGTSANTSECRSKKQPFTDYDLKSYCGCSGDTEPAICNYCSNGISDRSAVVEGSGGLTCGNFERLADYIKSFSTCTNWQACCRPTGTIAPQSGAFSSRTTKVAATMTTLALVSLFSM